MLKQLRKCLRVATFKSFSVKSGLRFALGPLVSSESFGSVFLDIIELNRTENTEISVFSVLLLFTAFYVMKMTETDF